MRLAAAGLKALRLWCGQPSLRRLRSLAGKTRSVTGFIIDALPVSTTSELLAGAKLPRLAFAEAFVTACFAHLAGADDDTAVDLAAWRQAWRRATDAASGAVSAPARARPTAPARVRPARLPWCDRCPRSCPSPLRRLPAVRRSFVRARRRTQQAARSRTTAQDPSCWETR